MAPGALTGMNLLRRVPALLVHVMHAVELDPAAVQVLAEDPVTLHPAVGPLRKAPQRCGKNEHPRSTVTQYLQLHVASQGGAVPPAALLLHRSEFPPLRSRNGSALRNRRPQADSSWRPSRSSTHRNSPCGS